MPEEKIDATGIPLFRLTLLGAHGVGKTCLANAIMNNVLPPTYQVTTLPELYYYLLRLSFDAPLINDNYDDINALCFEIEDTCADDPLPRLVDMSKCTWPFEVGMNDYTPFGIFNEPLVPLQKDDEFKPISQNRMAFLAIFDVCNYASFKYATSMVDFILQAHGRVGSIQPIVCLVGNKSDMLHDDAPIWDDAEAFSQSRTVPLYRTCTRRRKSVANMIREVALLLYGSLPLWEIVTHST
ncbi:Ras-related protein Rab-27A, related [Babesia divergens]|uniref:Ras-related protein Rab-27A, related n=1 Tax=Babesia divergens TaxID=32595 RepID=A0AAD9GJQ7_BABDI|nr:Ras-related protein Rab-27A, related [Babesia divergens]